MGWSEIKIQESSFRKEEERFKNPPISRATVEFFTIPPLISPPSRAVPPRTDHLVLNPEFSLAANVGLLTHCPRKHPPLQTSKTKQYSALKPHYLSSSNGALHLNSRVLRLEIVEVERMVGNRGKKPRIAAAEEADPVENDPLLPAVVKLQQIQDELEKVNEEANEEILEIQQEYANKRKPVYVRRNKIISEIPNFWLTSFLYHPTIEDLLTEQDKKMLEYLNSVNVEDFKDATKGYCITFNFKSNPFFKTKKLTRTIKFLDDGNLRSVGSTIYWKVGKGLADEKKRDKRLFPNDSFFSWLSSSKEDNKEVEHDLVAEIIREEIWPNPIGPLDIPADDFSDEDEEEETDEEDTDEDDEDEEDEDSKGKK